MTIADIRQRCSCTPGFGIATYDCMSLFLVTFVISVGVLVYDPDIYLCLPLVSCTGTLSLLTDST